MEEKHHILYPGDLAVVLPGQSFGGEGICLIEYNFMDTPYVGTTRTKWQDCNGQMEPPPLIMNAD
jgi:hypothetical protein